jgi:hypothetical protein
LVGIEEGEGTMGTVAISAGACTRCGEEIDPLRIDFFERVREGGEVGVFLRAKVARVA